MTEEAVVRVNQGRRIKIVRYFQAQPAATAQKVTGGFLSKDPGMRGPLKPGGFGLSGYFPSAATSFPAPNRRPATLQHHYSLNEDACPLLGCFDVFATTADFPDGLLDLLAWV